MSEPLIRLSRIIRKLRHEHELVSAAGKTAGAEYLLNILTQLESIMGQVAQELSALMQIKATDKATITSLQGQLAAAQANSLDAADQAEVATVAQDPDVVAQLAIDASNAATVTTSPTVAPTPATAPAAPAA